MIYQLANRDGHVAIELGIIRHWLYLIGSTTLMSQRVRD